jgi:hypothetical protein
MKISKKYQNYKFQNDGTLLRLIKGVWKPVSTNYTLRLNGRRTSVESSNFRSEFNIEDGEEDLITTKEFNNKEIWRTIPGYPVRVSSKGRCFINGNEETFSLSERGHPYICYGTEYGEDDTTFTLWQEVIKIKYPNYNFKRCKFLDGDKTNLNLDNLEDARTSKYWYDLNRREKSLNEFVPKEKITIGKEEFENLVNFNEYINEKYQTELDELRRENKTLKNRLGLCVSEIS